MRECRHCVERGSSVGRMPDSQSREPGFESPLIPFRSLWAFSFISRRLSRLSCINEYLAIDSGGNVSEQSLRNCCMARMLPREAENGVGMNRSARGGECKAL